MKTIVYLLLLLALFLMPNVLAAQQADIDTEITAEEQQQFDQILQPVFKIYNFVKYIATVVAVIFLLYAGISYMTSGNDPKKRDQAKNIVTYVVIGMVVIWAAPLLVNLLI
ncbi:MAG TPA: pilin [Candidatus Nanoarchaeia archaeon]|nr:pilin [Candidatus Nanoarchaeia archaeon]